MADLRGLALPVHISSTVNSIKVYYVAAAVVAIWLIRKWFTPRGNLPPGPPTLPIIGNMHLLGSHPHKALAKLAEKYGPLMTMRLGKMQTIIASSPEAAKEFLKTQDANFSNRPYTATGALLFYDRADIAFQSNTPRWRQLRKIFMLELACQSRLDTSIHIREDEVAYMLRAIHEKGEVEIKAHLCVMTLNITSRIVLNKRYCGISDEDAVASNEAKDFRHKIEEHFILAGMFNLGDLIPSLRWLDLQGIESRMKKQFKGMDEFVVKIISEHREKRMKGLTIEEKDMVDVLLDHMESKQVYQIMDDDVKNIILDAFLASTEAIIVSCEWAMAELLRNPACMKKAQAELDGFIGRDRFVQESDLKKLTYIQAIVKETFRIHPAAPIMIPHENATSSTAFGYDIPAHTRLFVNVWAIAHDPNIWDEPHEFKPDRFFEPKFAHIDVRGQDFELLPFGSGRRGCPGTNWGILVVQFAVASLLHSFDWSLPDHMDPKHLDMSDTFGLTTPKVVPLHVVAHARLSPQLYQQYMDDTVVSSGRVH